jgi:hypothetical protein
VAVREDKELAKVLDEKNGAKVLDELEFLVAALLEYDLVDEVTLRALQSNFYAYDEAIKASSRASTATPTAQSPAAKPNPQPSTYVSPTVKWPHGSQAR